MPLTLIDNKGRKYEVSIMEALIGSGRTIRSRKPSAKAGAKPAGDAADKKPEAKAEPATAAPAPANAETPANPPSALATHGASDATATSAATPTPAPASVTAPVPAEPLPNPPPNPPAEAPSASPPTPSTGPPAEAQNVASSVNAFVWTAEQDEQLLKLKGEGKAWNEIASILGKFKKQATSRYGELMKAESKQKEPAKKEVSKKEVPKKEEVVVVTVEEDKPDVADPSGFNMDALQSGVDPNVDPKHPYVIKQQKKAGNGKGKKAKEPIITPWADGNLSMSESVLLTRLHDFYETQKWVEISARFFDYTGRRFEPQLLRERMEEARFV